MTNGAEPEDVYGSGIPEAVRRVVLERDNWRCRRCGEMDLDKLTPHHVQYRSQGGDHDPDNIVTTCWRCHALIHKKLVRVSLINGEWFFGDVRHWRNQL